MKLRFRDIKLSKDNQTKLVQINSIIGEYRKLGLRLTLRQLYYQLVSRDIIPNKDTEYRKVSTLLKEGRMAGVVDWDAIEDRLRNIEKPSSWNTPADIMASCISSYEKPRMSGQDNYLEVWVEKDALSGVLSEVTVQYHVPILVNRGYSSVSAIYDSFNRFSRALRNGQKVVILYLGDFDPSGVDMIRDVYDRPLEMLLSQAGIIMDKMYDFETMFGDLYDAWEGDERSYTVNADENYIDRNYFDPWKALILDRFQVVSIALTRAQIDQYKPPPNPAKITDPRAYDFISKHGSSSWEVDALRPEVLNALLTQAIESRIDMDLYEDILEEEKADKLTLTALKDTLNDKPPTDEDDEDEDEDDE